MEIVCNQNEFNNAIQLVSKAVASRPTHPILSNLLLVDGKGKPSKIGFRFDKKTGKKERFFKTTGSTLK